MTILQQIKQYCNEDAREVIKKLNSITGKQFRLLNIDYSVDEETLEKGEDSTCNVEVMLGISEKHIKLNWSYSTSGDEIYLDTDIKDIVNVAKRQHNKLFGVKASTSIMAADDEMFDDEMLDDDTGFGDALDNLSDKVEDIQDQVDDVDEDPIDIQMENNISNHYIAECESCHGVFISAMVESDQEVTKISGKCPLCEKETDQYLKWVVKAVE